MNLIDQWNDIPEKKRHIYVILCVLLIPIAGYTLRSKPSAPVDSRQVDELVKVIKLQDAPPPPLNLR